MGAENKVGATGHLVDLVDKDCALLLKGRDNVNVVNDLLAHINGRAVVLEGFFYRDNSAVDSRAIASRSGKNNPLCPGNGLVAKLFPTDGNNRVGDGLKTAVSDRAHPASLGRWPAESLCLGPAAGASPPGRETRRLVHGSRPPLGISVGARQYS